MRFAVGFGADGEIINTGNQTVPLTLNFDHEYYQVNGTTLQNDDGTAHNSPENPNVVALRTLAPADLPMPGANNVTISASSTAEAMSTTMLASTDLVGQIPSTAASSLVAQATGSAKRWNGYNSWSWTVPVFSSTVLQFDP